MSSHARWEGAGACASSAGAWVGGAGAWVGVHRGGFSVFAYGHQPILRLEENAYVTGPQSGVPTPVENAGHTREVRGGLGVAAGRGRGRGRAHQTRDPDGEDEHQGADDEADRADPERRDRAIDVARRLGGGGRALRGRRAATLELAQGLEDRAHDAPPPAAASVGRW